MEVRPKLKRFLRMIRIENVEMERAHRIGKKERDDSSQKRTIIAKFLNYKDKEYCESTGLANFERKCYI